MNFTYFCLTAGSARRGAVRRCRTAALTLAMHSPFQQKSSPMIADLFRVWRLNQLTGQAQDDRRP